MYYNLRFNQMVHKSNHLYTGTYKKNQMTIDTFRFCFQKEENFVIACLYLYRCCIRACDISNQPEKITDLNSYDKNIQGTLNLRKPINNGGWKLILHKFEIGSASSAFIQFSITHKSFLSNYLRLENGTYRT